VPRFSQNYFSHCSNFAPALALLRFCFSFALALFLFSFALLWLGLAWVEYGVAWQGSYITQSYTF
jgi:hypothetical protein